MLQDAYFGKTAALSDAEKIDYLQTLFKSSSYKKDINVPSDVRYVKGFRNDGSVIFDWPDKLGVEEKSIRSITRSDGLPTNWDRYGNMGGSNFSDVPASGKYTYGERAIPYVENEAAYHTGTFNCETYFEKIDAIKNGDMDMLNRILKREGLEAVSDSVFKKINDQYNYFIEKTAGIVGTDIDVTYGLKGKANRWGKMEGGAVQIITPLSGDKLHVIGII